MSIQKIIDYAMHTPHNTNPAILKQVINDNISWNDLKDKPFYKKKETAITLNETDFKTIGDEDEGYYSFANFDALEWFVDKDSIDFEITVENVVSGKTETYTKDTILLNGFYQADGTSVFWFGNNFINIEICSGCYFDEKELCTIPFEGRATVYASIYGNTSIKQAILYKVEQKRLPEWSVPKSFVTPFVVLDDQFSGLVAAMSTDGELLEANEFLPLINQYFELAKWGKRNNAALYCLSGGFKVDYDIEPLDGDDSNPDVVRFYAHYIYIDDIGFVRNVVWMKEYYIDNNGNAWQKATYDSTIIGVIPTE